MLNLNRPGDVRKTKASGEERETRETQNDLEAVGSPPQLLLRTSAGAGLVYLQNILQNMNNTNFICI
jgi:hypothetical protein